MWLSFGVSSRYLCVYFQEIGKTQHLLIRSAICHTVRRLHSAPRSLRCMCKWVVLEITKHRLGRLFGVHLIPIVMTYSEPWSFLNLELRYPERLVFERKLLQDSVTPCLVFYAYNRHVTIYYTHLWTAWWSWIQNGCRIFTTFKSVKTIIGKVCQCEVSTRWHNARWTLMLMRFYQFRYRIGGTVCGQVFRLRGIPFLPNRR